MASRQVGVILTILGGVFYLFGSFAGAALSALFSGVASGITYNPGSSLGQPFNTTASETVGFVVLGLGLIAGGLIIVGGALLNSDIPGTRKIGGAIAIVMMIIGAVPTLGGLVIGFIFVLVGAIFGLTYKPTSPDIVIGYQQVPVPATAYAPTSYAPTNQPSNLKFCIKCGSSLHQGAVYCGSCGAPVPQA